MPLVKCSFKDCKWYSFDLDGWKCLQCVNFVKDIFNYEIKEKEGEE